MVSSTVLAETRLRSKEGDEIVASDLWKSGPVLVVCLRRPGCRKLLYFI